MEQLLLTSFFIIFYKSHRYLRGKSLGIGGLTYEITDLETKINYAAKIMPKSNLTKNRVKQKVKLHSFHFHLAIV